MTQPLLQIIMYSSIPVAATALGAALAVLVPPAPKIRSGIQHFAAGVVFSVVAVELLPDIIRVHDVREVVWGFALGIVMMLGTRYFTMRRAGGPPEPESVGRGSAGMLVAIGIDFSLDGLLVGIGFAAGRKEGVLLTIALSLELLSLGVAIASAYSAARRRTAILVPTGLALLLVAGAVVGGIALQHLSDHALAAILSFGCAALLFLVTEELLVEAHEVPETPATTAMFFAGFLLFLVLGMVG